MARPLRCAPPGTLHHVVARGNDRMRLYLDDEDCEHFLALLDEAAARYALSCYAYCLMPNHYHLLLQTHDGRLSAGMRQLDGVFAQRWNRRHDRAGHVLGARFKSHLVDQDRYFRAVCRYIVLNPVRAGLVAHPLDWPWSSHAAVLGARRCPPCLDVRRLLAHFGSRLGDARRAYRRLVEGEPGDRDREVLEAIRSDRRIIGSRAFVARFRDELESADPLAVPSRERLAARPDLADILVDTPLARRNEAIRTACVKYGYRQREVADHLSLHPASISRILCQRQEARPTRRAARSSAA